MTAETTLAKAVNEGLRRALALDERVMVMGEDVGRLGGVFRVTDGLAAEFGSERVVDTPLAESGIVGTAVGLAMRGYRPVCEIQFDGFLFPALDQVVNQVAKLHFRSGGAVEMPMVIRVPYGGGIGAVEHHSESPETYLVHTAGLRVVTPATPRDAYWMIQQAVVSDDPVMFLEPKRRYWDKGSVGEEPPAPLWSARVVREGHDVVLVGYGPTVKLCEEAAGEAAADGVSAAVVDLRSLSPLDWGTLVALTRRMGRVVLVHEAPRTLGLGAEIAARLTEECFAQLRAPVQRVTGYDTPYPPSRVEDLWLPDIDRVLDAVERVMGAPMGAGTGRVGRSSEAGMRSLAQDPRSPA
jgi:2-oxoisovalerate dehydrogenase E1 component beta subunit